MNINEMSDQEKSNKLIALMGWQKKWTDMESMVLLDSQGLGLGHKLMQSGEQMPNLYWPENMALAQKVLIWAHDHRDDLKMSVRGESTLAWFFAYTSGAEVAMDGVLSLAIDAGMVEDAAVSQEASE